MHTEPKRPEGGADDPLPTLAEAPRAELDRRLGFLPSRVSILALGFALALLGLSVFGWLAENVYDHEATILDDSLGPSLHALSSPALDATMRLASFIGSLAVIAALST